MASVMASKMGFVAWATERSRWRALPYLQTSAQLPHTPHAHGPGIREVKRRGMPAMMFLACVPFCISGIKMDSCSLLAC
jgi:hypothetical protein